MRIVARGTRRSAIGVSSMDHGRLYQTQVAQRVPRVALLLKAMLFLYEQKRLSSSIVRKQLRPIMSLLLCHANSRTWDMLSRD